MSDDERLDLRHQAPIVPPPRPERLSQTLLGYLEACMRAASFYLKYSGGAPAHELDRGTAMHLAIERATHVLLAAGEQSFYDPERQIEFEDGERTWVGGPPGEVAAMTEELLDEVLRERRDLQVPQWEADRIREGLYHWALAWRVDPEKVVAVERKFVLDLECGWTISGKIDFAQVAGRVADVVDYKSSFAMPTQANFDLSYQTKIYSVLLSFGQPVEKIGGEEVRLPALGGDIEWTRRREVYPPLRLRSDGTLMDRAQVLSRAELSAMRGDIERTAEKFTAALESGDFPATEGSHCNRCPSERECPLPRHLRRHAGMINTMEEASEAAGHVHRAGPRLAATREELREFAKLHGPVFFGRDMVFDFKPTENRDTDWPGLEEGVERAVRYGEPFDLSDYRKVSASQRFEARRMTVEEIEERESGGPKAPLDFGEDPPF